MKMGFIAFACACLPFVGSAYAQSSIAPWRDAQGDNPEVVITGNRQVQQNLKVTGLVTVITRQQIEESGAATVNESIMKLGGVIGTPSLFGGNEYTLDLGGYGDTAASNTVVILDGIPLREADQSETRLSSLSGILCLRHSMLERSIYAKQEETGGSRHGGAAVYSPRTH